MKIIKRQITEVENSEGCIFKIGDKVIKEHTYKSRTEDFETPSTIISFNIIKTRKGEKINAVTDFEYDSGSTNKNGISIDKISLYIDNPLISSKDYSNIIRNTTNIAKNSHYGSYPLIPEECYQSNETLLDKAKRLYPVGTIFCNKNLIPHCTLNIKITGDSFHNHSINEIRISNFNTDKSGTFTVYLNGQWAEIIEYPHGFKIGDKIRLRYDINNVYYINKIEGNRLIFETNSLPKINSMLAKNAIKVN